MAMLHVLFYFAIFPFSTLNLCSILISHPYLFRNTIFHMRLLQIQLPLPSFLLLNYSDLDRLTRIVSGASTKLATRCKVEMVSSQGSELDEGKAAPAKGAELS